MDKVRRHKSLRKARNLLDSDFTQDKKRFDNNIKREEFYGKINIIILISRKYRLNLPKDRRRKATF